MSSYRLYKDDTAAVMAHLMKEAEDCNVEIPKRAATVPNTSTTNAYLVAVNDIVPLARRVMNAAQKPTPAKVLRILGRAITSRRQFRSWYRFQSTRDPSLKASNTSHEHFNSVLDELLEVLNLCPVEAPKEQVEDATNTWESKTVWQSPLGDLELEPLSQEGPPEIPSPDDETRASDKGLIAASQSQKVSPPIVYEVEDPVEDLRFAIFNMTKDLHVLRQHIHGLLERYVKDDISLLSLSALINTAIGTVRRTEKDLLGSFSEFRCWENVMEAVIRPSQFKAVYTGLSNHLKTSSLRGFLNSLYCLPFEELRHFRDSIVNRKVPCRNGLVPTSRLEASQIDKVDGWETEKIILYEFFREILSLGSGGKLPTEDELTRGLVNVFKQKPIDLWVVFGLQLFLDTQRILGEHVTRPFRELQATGSVYRANVERRIMLTQVTKKCKYTEKEKMEQRQNLDLVDTWISKDEFLRLRQRQPTLGSGRSYFFFSHNPVVCGLFQFALLLDLQHTGIIHLNNMAYALITAHLYNAAQTESHLTTNWPDMEKLIEFYGNKDLFIGGPPKTVNQYLSQFLMAKGISPQQFAKDRRDEGIIYSKHNFRLLKISEIMENFERLLCKSDKKDIDINVDLIETFLHRMAHTRSPKKEQGVIHKRWKESQALTPIQLLTLLEQCMEEEKPKLSFNYVAFYQSSWRVLASIVAELGPEFTEWLDRRAPKHKDNINDCLHHLPHFVFEKLQGGRESGKAVAMKENILARVAGIIDDVVSRVAKDPSPTVLVTVDDKSLTTESEHGTQDGLCIHWGRCEKTRFR